MEKELKENISVGVIFAGINRDLQLRRQREKADGNFNGKSCSFSSLCGRNIRLWKNQKVVALALNKWSV